ncbi:hypothetical protein F2P81_010406 [Scophthalmus maximus]|uniref:Phospholipid phosphatase-related protein type 5 n=1 Tax=Scophthalmus maximus TaxID=52904 RepID=A0A6A4T5Q2_SCOMX|nr:hypothetical protein F2P81_010406 [Scophthalmus maximus]
MRNLPEDQGLQKTSTYIVPCFLFVELVIMAGTVLLAYYFEYTDTFPVHIQGFFCFDKAYSKPYLGPEDNSKAPPVLVYSLVTAIPTVTILIGEVTSFFVKTEGAQEKTIVTADCCYFNPLLRRIVRFLGVYSFGLFTTTIFANAGQVVTGNQTPHFLSACKPNYTALGCQSPLHYITERRACTGNPYVVASARKSFPSKDAALSFYSAIYTVMYVTLVFRTKGTRLTKPTLCLVLLSLAVLVGVVRVTEHRNHWNDVLAGFVTGGAIAAFLPAPCGESTRKVKWPPGLDGGMDERKRERKRERERETEREREREREGMGGGGEEEKRRVPEVRARQDLQIRSQGLSGLVSRRRVVCWHKHKHPHNSTFSSGQLSSNVKEAAASESCLLPFAALYPIRRVFRD